MVHETVRKLRSEKGWTMVFVADKLNIPYPTYNGYESGRRKFPNQVLYNLSILFSVPMEIFFDGEEGII